jgi:hypothetical protein
MVRSLFFPKRPFKFQVKKTPKPKKSKAETASLWSEAQDLKQKAIEEELKLAKQRAFEEGFGLQTFKATKLKVFKFSI